MFVYFQKKNIGILMFKYNDENTRIFYFSIDFVILQDLITQIY